MALNHLSAPIAQNGLWRRLGLIVLLVLSVQALGGLATASSVTSWYPTLSKASWNPPAYVFGPVWTTLYALMAWAGWHVWQHLVTAGVAKPWSHPAMRAFGTQLALNLCWSCLFFGLRMPLLAAIEIMFLFAAILWMLREFARIDRMACYSQIPYAVWVAFASTLNVAIVVLNA